MITNFISGEFPSLKFNKTVHYRFSPGQGESAVITAKAESPSVTMADWDKLDDAVLIMYGDVSEIAKRLVNHYVPPLFPAVRAKFIQRVIDTINNEKSKVFYMSDYSRFEIH